MQGLGRKESASGTNRGSDVVKRTSCGTGTPFHLLRRRHVSASAS